MARTLKLGMIGCGGNARGHLRRLTAHAEVEVTALVDPVAENLARARREVPAVSGAAGFADHREMLKSTKLDAAVISTPHTLHAGQILDCLGAGLHVLSEKPLTCSVSDTRKVIAAAKRRRRAVVVSFQRRFMNLRRFIRERVREKAFGRPLFVQAYQSQAWLVATRGTWRQTLALSGGGQLNDSGAHIIDMIFWTMPSRPVEVSALIEHRGAEVDIDSAVSFRFADGALGNLSVVGSGPPGVFWEDMTITGDGGQGIFLRDGVVTVVADGTVAEYKSFGRDGTNADDHFIDVVRRRARNASPPEEALPAIAFTEACWKSARQGGRCVKIRY